MARKPKNIVICSDGTGNRWGVGAQTNVSRLYQAIDTRGPIRQIRFYDNGVGTSANKYLRALTGAFGFGLQRNVLDIYEFLARNWQPEDRIFLFGFSRGAATVRGFAGMLQECGLVWITGDHPDAKCYDETRLEELLGLALDAYRHRDPESPGANRSRLERFRESVRVSQGGFNLERRVPIEMIGVWDTVSALGFPCGPLGLQWLFDLLESGADLLFPHSFYDYGLDDRVAYACHALAIDDERRSFRPNLWNELQQSRPAQIEQVWFAGMHSDVGGGYARSGLSSVTLAWMMAQAATRGLAFRPSAMQEASDDANPHGKLHNSRDGFAIFYRYHPRDLVRLGELGITTPHATKGQLKIHQSVLERLQEGTARYAPGLLPENFVVVGNPTASAPPPQRAVTSPDPDTWRKSRERVLSATAKRSALYHGFIYVTLALVAWMIHLWRHPPQLEPGEPRELRPAGDSVEGVLDGVATASAWIFEKLADALYWALPRAMEGLVSFTIVEEPVWLVGLLALGAAMLALRERLFAARDRAAQQARKGHLQAWSSTTGSSYVVTTVQGRAAIRPISWQSFAVKTLALLVGIGFFFGAVRLSFEDQGADGAAMTVALIVAAPIAAVGLFSVLFRLTGRDPGSRPLDSRRRGYDVADVGDEWSERDLQAERRFLLADLLFAPVYGAALALGFALGGRFLGWTLQPLHFVPLALLVVADWIENAVLLVQLGRFSASGASALQAGWIRVASLATTIKIWGAIVVGMGGVIVLATLVVLRALGWY